LVILLTMSICVGLFANKIPTQTYELSPSANINGITTLNREMWDILFTFNTSAAYMAGIETDGVNIYTSAWNASTFSRYDMYGVHLNDFTIGGVGYVRDMAFNGTYFYGSDASMNIFIMDLANENLIGTIPVTCAGISGVRHIAFDPQLDEGNGGFWIGNWDELGAVTMSGAQIHASMANPEDLYGSAYDDWTEGGPYLWLFSQTDYAVLHQFDIAALAVTGVTHDATDIPGYIPGGIAGGLATYTNNLGAFAMLTNIQQSVNPNLVGVYEIAIVADPESPSIPTDVTLTADAGGALEATIGWTCPNTKVNGDPLTDLDEMRVYRGLDIIYTDSAPVIGGSNSYTDSSVPASATYTYRVVGFNDFDEGLAAYRASWVGEDVPNVVTDLLLEQTATGELSATLTWVNPTNGLHGGSFNEPILGYHIERSDGTVLEVSGIVTEYIDDALPGANYYYYMVVPYNLVGDGDPTTSNTVFIGPNTISGTVELLDGWGNVEDVVIEAGGETTNPFANGTYFIELEPGTYDVTATIAGYGSETIEDVVVIEGSATTGINFWLVTGSEDILISATQLNSNYPNPFNPVTNIAYSIKETGNVTIEVYNLKGQLVKMLINDVKETGDYTTIWDGTDSCNNPVSSGVYFYKMKSGNYTETKKMILMK
ncbi:MAG: T9SS type A sorting domain-containing protein, partial [Candidatus Cloacimonetes bacterium]|nr:T9SS type A sorting domain-containing protein [Candidatus Cloacimonadota bacterium]